MEKRDGENTNTHHAERRNRKMIMDMDILTFSFGSIFHASGQIEWKTTNKS